MAKRYRILLVCLGCLLCFSVSSLGEEIAPQTPTHQSGAKEKLTPHSVASKNRPTNSYAIQLVPFQNKNKAEAALNELKGDGFDPFIFSLTSKGDGKNWYAVRIGEYPDIDTARNALYQFKKRKKLPAFITEVDSMKAAGAVGSVVGAAGAKITGESADQSIEIIQLSSTPTGTISSAESASLQAQLESLQKEVQTIRDGSDVRKKLQVTEEEKEQAQEEVLTSAGRQYTLLSKDTLGLEYSFRYSYTSSDSIDAVEIIVDPRAHHVLTNSIFTQYALKDNLTINSNIPFVYAYDQQGGDDEKDVTDLGDISIGAQYQPFKSGGKWPTTILSTTFTLPTGRDPYDIDPDDELSTGSGAYSASLGASVSESLDPLVAFGSLSFSYSYNPEDYDQRWSNGLILKEVNPGPTIGASAGFGYAMTYNLNFNMSYSYGYNFGSEFKFKNAKSIDGVDSVSSSLSLGMGYRVSPKYSLHSKLGIGLTDDGPDFTLSFRVPFDFDLGS